MSYPWRVEITYDFEDETTAEAARAAMEEVGGQHNGELNEARVWNLDEEGE
jgi:hypothetical protein